jgi:selenocysteine lyase/cysteine desulfurase
MQLRPIDTGWFAGFAELEAPRDRTHAVGYAREGSVAFAGSTFDPASAYRAVAVTRFARTVGLADLAALRALYTRQTARIVEHLARLGLPLASPPDPAARGGFVAVETPRARELVEALRAEGIYSDSRGSRLRLGPAPYVTDDEIDVALDVLARAMQR